MAGMKKNGVDVSDHKPTADHVAVVQGVDGYEVSMDAARAANDEEHTLTVTDALRLHWKAVMWSLIISMSIIMEGYDTSLIYNFFAYPAFRRQFGEQRPDGIYEVPGHWQSALGSVNTAGCIIGAFLNGYLIKIFGFRPTFIAGLAFMCGAIFISFFGQTVLIQTVGQAMCGYVSLITLTATFCDFVPLLCVCCH
jgi:MFS transporter, SP family, general alpha glucoside:H+ symporter